MTFKTKKYSFLVLALATILLSACKKEVGGEENEEEIITTLQLVFTPQGGGTSLTYAFEDPDGPGGIAPAVDNIRLAAHTTYAVVAAFLNKTENPVDDITPEIVQEGESHRIYYIPSAGSNITVSNLSLDVLGMPLGVTSTWQTGAVSTGTVTVTLRHYGGNPPNKGAGDPVDSPKSSTDAEVAFPVIVE